MKPLNTIVSVLLILWFALASYTWASCTSGGCMNNCHAIGDALDCSVETCSLDNTCLFQVYDAVYKTTIPIGPNQTGYATRYILQGETCNKVFLCNGVTAACSVHVKPTITCPSSCLTA